MVRVFAEILCSFFELHALGGFDAGAVEIEIDGDSGVPQTVSFDPRRYQSFDHGYAVTVHKSQGATVDQAYVLASRTMDDPLSYVAMTRHREEMKLYLYPQDMPTWGHASEPRLQKNLKFRRHGPSR